MRRALWSYIAALALAASPAAADVWDVQGDNDNTFGTDNELIHGTVQTHDLGVLPGPATDQDWFRISQKPYSSYEMVLDSTSGDIGFGGLTFQRIASDGTTVLQDAASIGVSYSRSLRWANTTAVTVNGEFIRVATPFCGTGCGSDDVYQIRAQETTISVARFNNSGTQITVIVTQNPTDLPINATFFYWSTAGVLLQTGTLTPLAAKSTNVFALTGFPSLVGQNGSITIAHDGPYRSLNVKTVALEPSTGFSFDTPGVYR